MMAEIELFIKQSYNPEVCALFYRSFDAFDDLYSDVDYNAPYIAILMDTTNEESSSVIDKMYARLRDDVKELITLHSVEVSDDAELRHLVSILEGLSTVQDYEDRNAVLTIIDTGNDSIEMFAQIMGLVSDLNENDVYITVDSVRSELFTKLVDFLDPNNDSTSDDEQEEVDQELLAKLKDFVDYCKDTSTYAIQLVKGGFAIGAVFDNYIKVATAYLDTLTDDDQYALELMAFLYLSKDAYMKPLQFYQEHSSNIVSDDDKITRVYVKIKNRIADFEAYVTNKTVASQGVVNA